MQTSSCSCNSNPWIMSHNTLHIRDSKGNRHWRMQIIKYPYVFLFQRGCQIGASIDFGRFNAHSGFKLSAVIAWNILKTIPVEAGENILVIYSNILNCKLYNSTTLCKQILPNSISKVAHNVINLVHIQCFPLHLLNFNYFLLWIWHK